MHTAVSDPQADFFIYSWIARHRSRDHRNAVKFAKIVFLALFLPQAQISLSDWPTEFIERLILLIAKDKNF